MTFSGLMALILTHTHIQVCTRKQEKGYVEMHLNKIKRCGTLPPTVINSRYKETKVMWLSARMMVFSNNEVPINKDIVAALNIIVELIHKAKVDRIMYGYTQKLRESRNIK